MKKQLEDNFNTQKKNQSLLISTLVSNKYPLTITLIFFMAISYVSFFHHHYFFESDGIYYLLAGKQILGNAKDAFPVNAPIGGPILFASLDSFVHDGFLVMKIISLLSGTSIVFVSYYLIRNIFNHRTALLGQIFVAVTPLIGILSIESLNALLPVFLIVLSLYFITKRKLKLSDVIITGSLLGAAFMFRYQAIAVLFALTIFLLVHNSEIRNNLKYILLMIVFFLIVASPLFIYNYITYGAPISSGTNYYAAANTYYQTTEWHEKMLDLSSTNKLSTFAIIFFDFGLFIKNYFYNLFFNNFNFLFNYNSEVDNLSIFPIIPLIGILPFIGGIIYCIKIKLNKKNLTILTTTALITGLLVILIGDITVHFFAIIMIPLLVIGIFNIRNIERNFLPLLILAVVYLLILSVIRLYWSENFLPMWFLIPAVSATFLLEGIPKIYSKIIKSESNNSTVRVIIISLVLLILFMNIGYTYGNLKIWLYQTHYTNLKDEILKLFQKQNPIPEKGYEYKKVADLLSQQPGIENSYVMSTFRNYAYYANSKFMYSSYHEGKKNDSINRFITRENWSPSDLYLSNINSYPPDPNNKNHPIPDYLIYYRMPPEWIEKSKINSTQIEDLMILSDPNNPKIPTNFKLIYYNNETGTVVYKINHNN